MATAGGVPGIVVLALGAGALGGPDALRFLIALAGRNPAVDIGICVFVFSIFTAQLLGAVLVSRFVRKAPRAPAADPFARITLLMSLAVASLVTACLLVVSGGPGSVRPLVDLAAEYFRAIVIASAAAGAALLYATPLLRALRDPRNARGRAARAARSIGLPLAAAAYALVVAILSGTRGGLDALRPPPGFTIMDVAVAVGAAAGAALPCIAPLLRAFREQRNPRGRAAHAERATTTHDAARSIGAATLAAAAGCALLVAFPSGARGGLDAARLPHGLTNMAVAAVGGAALLVRFHRRARNAPAPAAAAPRTRRASAR